MCNFRLFHFIFIINAQKIFLLHTLYLIEQNQTNSQKLYLYEVNNKKCMPAVLQNMQIYFVNFQIEDYSLVKFLPLDMSEEESINDLLLQIDNAIQYGEDLEPKEFVSRFYDFTVCC